MATGTAHHRLSEQKIIYKFNTKEKWRESCINKGYTGIPAKILLKFHPDFPKRRQWYRDFKHWMEFSGQIPSEQKRTRAFVLAKEIIK